MKIQIPHGNENFSVVQHPVNDWILIKPAGVKQRWSSNELWWRSMVTDLEGNVLSAGLPKFKNYTEDLVDTFEFEQALSSNSEVLFLEKLDGSMAIRSVVDGEVVWRTRGTFGTEDNQMLRDIRQLAERYDPVLADPTAWTYESLHFEFCHPDHQIILPVHEPSLTLISRVRHENLHLLPHKTLHRTAVSIGCPVVEAHTLPRDVTQLVAMVDAFKGREGIVARWDNEQRYIKIKSAEYLAQHRLRYSFTPRNAITLCREHNFQSGEDFVNHLHALGLDWEIASERVRWYHVFDAARSFVIYAMVDVSMFVATNGGMYGTKQGSKEYARLVMETYDDPLFRTACFSLASGKATLKTAAQLMMDKVVEVKLKEAKVEESV